MTINCLIMCSEDRLLYAIQRASFGTDFRDALERIIHGNTGALILLQDDAGSSDSICQDGFRIDTEFTPQRLAELTKMDGAVILDNEVTSIRGANVFLTPKDTVPTTETGTRHRTAHRVAKSTNACVVSVSQRRGTITIFVDDLRYTTSHLHSLLNYIEHGLRTAELYANNLLDDVKAASKLFPDPEELAGLGSNFTATQLQEKLRKKLNELRYSITEIGSDGDLFKSRLDRLERISERE